MSKKVIDVRVMAIRGRSKGDWYTSAHNQQCELGEDVTNSLTSVAKDNYVVEFYEDERIEDVQNDKR